LPLALLGACLGEHLAQACPQRNYRSADGALRAVVLRTPTHESRIELRTARDGVLLTKSFASPDGEQGRVVKRAAWTPDAQFFVFSTLSSGGHSPWHHTTYFYSWRANKLSRLDDFTGAVTTPHFTLRAPDLLTTRRQEG